MTRPSVQDALDSAVRSVANLPPTSTAIPLRPLPLVMSAIAIALAALAFAALAAAVAAIVFFLVLGRDGWSDLLTDMRFEAPLKARLAAFAVSALYVGVGAATLVAARWRGGRGAWPALLAVGTARRARGAPTLALATLCYATAFTLVQVVGHERRLLIAGPTDFLLLGTLAANLVVLAPLAEELFFRGWIYTALRARWPFGPSFLVTAGAFAVMHVDADHRHMLRVLPLALALGLLREFTGSTRPAIALHATYNLVIVAITLIAA